MTGIYYSLFLSIFQDALALQNGDIKNGFGTEKVQ